MEKVTKRGFSLEVIEGNSLDGFRTVTVLSDIEPIECYRHVDYNGVDIDCDFDEVTKTLVAQDGVLYLVTQEHYRASRGARYPDSYNFREEEVCLKEVDFLD